MTPITMLLLLRKVITTDPSSVKRILPPSFANRRLAAVGSKKRTNKLARETTLE